MHNPCDDLSILMLVFIIHGPIFPVLKLTFPSLVRTFSPLAMATFSTPLTRHLARTNSSIRGEVTSLYTVGQAYQWHIHCKVGLSDIGLSTNFENGNYAADQVGIYLRVQFQKSANLATRPPQSFNFSLSKNYEDLNFCLQVPSLYFKEPLPRRKRFEFLVRSPKWVNLFLAGQRIFSLPLFLALKKKHSPMAQT